MPNVRQDVVPSKPHGSDGHALQDGSLNGDPDEKSGSHPRGCPKYLQRGAGENPTHVDGLRTGLRLGLVSHAHQLPPSKPLLKLLQWLRDPSPVDERLRSRHRSSNDTTQFSYDPATPLLGEDRDSNKTCTTLSWQHDSQPPKGGNNPVSVSS